MEIILKKPLWFTVLTILCLIVVTLFAAVGCDKSETPPKTCNVENSLTDLSWLKEVVDGFESDAVALGYNPHARIYQCSYKDGIGFLLEMCVDCPDAGYSFRSCEGVVLCGGGGHSGEDNCSGFNIDLENKKLIWEFLKNDIMNNSCEFENPLTDLPWLKEIIDGIEKDAEAGHKQHAKIYQCTYTDGIGFLLELCVGCPDFGYWLRSCEGESLCTIYGHAGDPCQELNVDFENKKLIWEINN